MIEASKTEDLPNYEIRLEFVLAKIIPRNKKCRYYMQGPQKAKVAKNIGIILIA